MTKGGLDFYIDGGWPRAKGTTLGADDDVVLTYALALFDSPTLRHPRLEFICTVSEETDVDGAHAVDVSMLKGNRMLNLDSDGEGITLMGCTGGGDADITLPIRHAAARGEHICLTATGLTGGHSDMEIGKGRASAALLLVRVPIGPREGYAPRLTSLEGDAKYNAITREASAKVVLADSVSTSAFREAVKTEEAVPRREYATINPNLSLTVAIADSEEAVLAEDSTKQVLGLMGTLLYGVQRMSADIDGLVEVSVDLDITELGADKLALSYSIRSSIATAFQAVIGKPELVSGCFGTAALVHSIYPARGYVRESTFRDKTVAIYHELFGGELSVQAIHAGLECDIFSEKIKNLDAVSIRPDMRDTHAPEGRLNIPSTERVYGFIVEIMKHKSK